MSRALLLLLACLVGCAANHPGPPPSPAAESVDPFPTEEGRLALFEELVTDIRDFHVFAPNAFENLGRSWEDDLPDLEQEFRGAEDDAALALALRAPRHDLSRPGTSLTEQTGHIVYTSSSRLVDRVVGSEPQAQSRPKGGGKAGAIGGGLSTDLAPSTAGHFQSSCPCG